MRALRRAWCWFAGHDWNRITVGPRAFNLFHLHPLAGCDADCRRCGEAWRDIEDTERVFTAIERYLERIITRRKTMTFGEAIELAKQDKKIRRAGWNGKGMWVCHMPAVRIPEGIVNGRAKKFLPTGDLKCGAYLVMMTADGTWQPGWLASQADILSTDWELVDEPAVKAA